MVQGGDDTRVDHDGPPFEVEVGQRPVAQPADQRIAVRGVEHVPEGVLAPELSHTLGARDEVQIVVAEHDAGPVPEIGGETQHVEGVRAAVDEVAGEPETIPPGVEAADAQQGPQLGVTALYVPDRVDGHCRAQSRTRRTTRSRGVSPSGPPPAVVPWPPAVEAGVLNARGSARTG